MSEAVDLQSGQIASMSKQLCCCGDIPKGSVSETFKCENYAVVPLFFLNFLLFMQDLLS